MSYARGGLGGFGGLGQPSSSYTLDVRRKLTRFSSGLSPVFSGGAEYSHRLILLAEKGFLLSTFTKRPSFLFGNEKKRSSVLLGNEDIE